MINKQEAQNAIRCLHGHILNGNQIKVQVCCYTTYKCCYSNIFWLDVLP